MPSVIKFSKTRIAPTPSGYLHLGNIYAFVVTVGLAEKHGANILLRIDDLDHERVREQYLQDVFDTLNFLDIPWHEGPHNLQEHHTSYAQVHRSRRYFEALDVLRTNGSVFACSCSRKQVSVDNDGCDCRRSGISLDDENVSWRLITDTNTEVKVKTYTGERQWQKITPEMNNIVVKRRDGQPAYQLTSVVDDLYFGVDLIVRGNDLWPSTLVQHVIASALNKPEFNDITFYHHALLTGADGKKLSKSAGSSSVQYLRKSGMSAPGVYSQIAKELSYEHPVTTWQELAEITKL